MKQQTCSVSPSVPLTHSVLFCAQGATDLVTETDRLSEEAVLSVSGDASAPGAGAAFFVMSGAGRLSKEAVLSVSLILPEGAEWRCSMQLLFGNGWVRSG